MGDMKDIGNRVTRLPASLRCPPNCPSPQPAHPAGPLRRFARRGEPPGGAQALTAAGRPADPQGPSGRSERTPGAPRSWCRDGGGRGGGRVRFPPAWSLAVFIRGLTRLETHVTRSPRDFLLNI